MPPDSAEVPPPADVRSSARTRAPASAAAMAVAAPDAPSPTTTTSTSSSQATSPAVSGSIGAVSSVSGMGHAFWTIGPGIAVDGPGVARKTPGMPDPPTDQGTAAPVALVSGAGRGIGRAVAEELASRGWDVVAGVRRPGAVDPPARTRVVRLDVDAPDPAVVPDRLELLVNNAGVDTDNLPVEAVPASEWERVFRTNVFGVAELTRLALPALRAGAPSVVCNLTSAGLAVPMPFFGVYRASKAAVSALSETLAVEVAPLGIRVVEILPGPVDTDMLAGSATVPEAAGVDGYRALAELIAELRPATDDQKVPAQQAAAAIVDHVEAARAAAPGAVPLRGSCDPVGTDVVRTWQDTPDQAHIGLFMEVFRPPSGP